MTRSAIALLIACLSAVLAASPLSGAPRPWSLVRGQSVIVVGQQSSKTLREVAVEIEQFKAAIGESIRGAGEPLTLPTVVYTFDDRKAMEPFVPLYRGKPAALGGFCRCGSPEGSFIAVSLSTYSDSSAIVFHEYTHLLVRQVTQNLPVWLNEGLAEFYSTFHLRNGAREAEVGVPIPEHVALLRRRYVPIAELIAVDQSSALYNESDRRSIFYAEAWALTHYLLMERPGGVAAVNTYVRAVAKGSNAIQAFADAFGATPTAMDEALQQYVRRPAFRSAIHTLAERIAVGEPEQAHVIPDAQAEAMLGTIQLHVGRMDEATSRIEAAAAAGPGLAQTQLALGLLRLEQSHPAQALPPLEAAARLAPDDFVAQYTFALTMLQQEGDHAPTSDDQRERAHAALTRAIAINPRSADALAWQAYADLLLNTRIPEARAAMVRAVELAPERPEYRLRLAEVYVRQGDHAHASTILASLAEHADAHVSQAARTLLTQVRAADRRREANAAAAVAAAYAVNSPRPAAGEREAGATESGAEALAPRAYVPLRPVRRGEERAYGELTQVDCSSAGVRLFLKVGTRTISTTAKLLADVIVTSFVDDNPSPLSCGTRVTPESVYMTWRTTTGARTGSAPIVGKAVAVEFVPKNAVPRRD
jgi:tetratricopeptide (TPR) repeat protein